MVKHYSDKEVGNIENWRENVQTEDREERNLTTGICKEPITKESLGKEIIIAYRGIEMSMLQKQRIKVWKRKWLGEKETRAHC